VARAEVIVNPAKVLERRCPACGGPLGGFPADYTCAGVRCLSCDWIGAVTTNPNHPSFDHTPYSVWVECGRNDRKRVIAKVGNAMCIGVKAARALIEGGCPVRIDANVNEVRRLYHLFRSLGLRIRVEPEFPWGWEPSPAEKGVLTDPHPGLRGR